MINVHYDILIDGNPYEGNDSLEVALHLYATLDNTCLRDYYGHVKSLKVTEGSQAITLKEEKIGKPLLSLRIHYKDGSQKEKQLKIFPEETLPYLQKIDPSTTKVEILNSDNEIVLEYGKE